MPTASLQPGGVAFLPRNLPHAGRDAAEQARNTVLGPPHGLDD